MILLDNGDTASAMRRYTWGNSRIVTGKNQDNRIVV